MPGPSVEHRGHRQPPQKQRPDLHDHLRFRDLPGRDRPVRLVDGVDLAVKVVVDRLGVPREQGAAHRHAERGLGDVLGRPVEVPGGRGTAEHAPDERDPGHGLGQLEADLPERVDVVGGALDAEELGDVLLHKVLGVFGRRRGRAVCFGLLLGGGAGGRGEGGGAAVACFLFFCGGWGRTKRKEEEEEAMSEKGI